MKHSMRSWKSSEYLLVAMTMGLMGAFFWAIRGTGGFGGEMGGALAGFGWALLWYAYSRLGEGAERRPYGSPWILVALTAGIAYGGLTGYGVYIAWLRGRFYADYPNLLRDVPAWTGYAMLFVCGLHWGGNAGCLMAWCAPSKPVRALDWLLRIALGIGGAIAAAQFVRACPQLFLPFYHEGIYDIPEYKTCVRALDSLHTIAPHVGLFLGFLAYEILRGDRRAVGMILTVALGFAIPFTVGGYWQTFNDSALKIGWWKNWEMTIGLGGGLSLGLAFWLFNKPAEGNRASLASWSRAFFRSGFPLVFPSMIVVLGAYDGWCKLHEIEVGPTRFLVILAMGGIAMIVAWIWRMRHQDAIHKDAEYCVPFPAIGAFLAMIVVAGWVVSIPAEWRLANVVLAVLYTLYIGVSLVLAALLWRAFSEQSAR